jgi:hypothetical protein
MKYHPIKYFFNADDFYVYAVPKKYQYLLDIINNPESEDTEINEASEIITTRCRSVLFIDATTQTL